MSEMNDGNVAIIKVKENALAGSSRPAGAPRGLHLVIEEGLLEALKGRLPEIYRVTPAKEADAEALTQAVAGGDGLVWLAAGEGLPKELSVGAFRPSEATLAVALAEGSPLPLGATAFGKARLHSAYIAPPKEMPAHNFDEEVRADFLPILEARDRFGKLVAYPGVLMNYYAPSLAGGRFGGSPCAFFLFDRPAEALAPEGWLAILELLARRFQSGLQIKRVATDYASYQSGERVRACVQLANHLAWSTAAEIRFFLKGPGEQAFRPVKTMRRCPAPGDVSEAVCSFPLAGAAGLWTLRVEVGQDPEHPEELGRLGAPCLLDAREIGVLLLDGELESPVFFEVSGASIRIDGEDNFWAGTHYYPSSSWWEWLWRDFQPHLAARDFAAIRREGYRLVRIWTDPVLDEESLRAMDAAIWLAAREGIILDICIFSQWMRQAGFERPGGEHVLFDFRAPGEFNIFSISLHNMDLQREYAALLARRWRGAGNVLYNLTNETYIKDPDASQMDAEVARWEGIPAENGTLRDTLLFRRWGRAIADAMREAGARQPIMPGYMFSTLKGGDTYLGNRDAEIMPWHCYYEPEVSAVTLNYFDSACSGRPIILEEFGTLGWNPAGHYDGCAHYALAGGAAAAMSYEWGVSWLARENCYYALPIREALDSEPDPRWFPPAVDIAKSWPARGVGLCLTPSGFGFGSIYHGTPFPAEAAMALGRLGRMGQGLGRAVREEAVYVLIATAASDRIEETYALFRELWRRKVVFGVWHEDCLEALPHSARVVIAPLGLAGGEGRLDALRRAGVEVYVGLESGWSASAKLARAAVTPDEATNLFIRRTVEGTLYMLTAQEKIEAVKLETPAGGVAEMGLQSFALAHERTSGIGMIEAAGRVTIGGAAFCEIETGRALIASATAGGLMESERLRVLATAPTRIRFSRAITRVTTEGGGAVQPADGDRTTLAIDDEMVRHVLILELAEVKKQVS